MGNGVAPTCCCFNGDEGTDPRIELGTAFMRDNEDCSPTHPTVVLVGGTGTGKSNLGNFLLGADALAASVTSESVTTSATAVQGTWFGGSDPVCVVDCSGIGDTKGGRADQVQWDTAIAVLKDLEQANAIVLCMKAGRFTQFDSAVVHALRDSFGVGFWRSLRVFYTGATARPALLDLDVETPKLLSKLLQIEVEKGGHPEAMACIMRIPVYAADLHPPLCSLEGRDKEFTLRPALRGVSLARLLEVDRSLPPDVMELSRRDLDKLLSEVLTNNWIDGNYYQLGLSQLLRLKEDVEGSKPFAPGDLKSLAYEEPLTESESTWEGANSSRESKLQIPEDQLLDDSVVEQIAVLSARQAAFEAKIGNTVAKISGKVKKVGDVAGTRESPIEVSRIAF